MLESVLKPFDITERSLTAHAFSNRFLKDYPAYLEALLHVKSAAARANFASSLMSEEDCQRIQEACRNLALSEYSDLFQADVFQGGGGIAIHTNVNEAIQAFVQESGFQIDLQTKINLSQSTSDVLSSAASVTVLGLLNPLILVLQESSILFQEKASAMEGVRTMARTCLRDAMPAPLSKLFEGYSLLIQRQVVELQRHLPAFESISLGGTVIGSGEGAPLTYKALVIPFLSELTGYPLRKKENLFDSAQNCDHLGNLSASLSQVASSWVKIAKDLRLMASGPLTGLNEITLPKAIPGSSFFKDKTNPTLPETVLQACFLVLGNHRTVQAAQEHGELYLNIFEPCASLKVFESLEFLRSSIQKFNEFCLKGMIANAESCERWVSIWESKQNA
jgi:aspartate ammonia-lyase